MPPCFTQAAGATEHHSVSNEPPALFRDPAVFQMPHRCILLAGFLQLPKKICLLILLLYWWELQGELLATLVVKLQSTVPSPHDGRDNSPMVRGMEPRLPKRHIAKKLRILAPRHTVVWLGLIPMYPSPLLPSPPCSLLLSLAMLLDVFLGHVDKVYFVKQVRNGFLPAGSRGPKVYIQIP
jgi:hypothetical protein